MKYFLTCTLLALGLIFSGASANAAAMPMQAGLATSTVHAQSAVTPVRGWWAVPVIAGGVILYHHYRHHRRCYRRCYWHYGHRHCRRNCYY